MLPLLLFSIVPVSPILPLPAPPLPKPPNVYKLLQRYTQINRDETLREQPILGGTFRRRRRGRIFRYTLCLQNRSVFISNIFVSSKPDTIGYILWISDSEWLNCNICHWKSKDRKLHFKSFGLHHMRSLIHEYLLVTSYVTFINISLSLKTLLEWDHFWLERLTELCYHIY